MNFQRDPNSNAPNPNERDLETIAGWVLRDESAEEEVTLSSEIASQHPVTTRSLEVVAAMVQNAMIEPQLQAMPSHLAKRISERLQSQPLATSREERRDDSPSTSNQFVTRRMEAVEPKWRESLSWLVAAACLLIAFSLWWKQNSNNLASATPLASRWAQLEKTSGVEQLVWKTGPKPGEIAASGKVLWNPVTGEGLMSFRDLPANDPKKEQYQLWIVDSERTLPEPVDGGVFDIPPGNSESLVPISPKLKIGKAAAFVITIEPPGGVVVSRQERVPLTAAK